MVNELEQYKTGDLYKMKKQYEEELSKVETHFDFYRAATIENRLQQIEKRLAQDVKNIFAR